MSDLKWEQRFKEAERLHGDRIEQLEDTAKSVDDWRPKVDAAVDHFKLKIGKLNRHWDRSLHDLVSSDLGIIPNPKSASGRPYAMDPSANGPSGHRADTHHRDEGFGTVFTQFPIPVKGTTHPPSSIPHKPSSCSYDSHSDFSLRGKLPKLNFPNFEGNNPKLWLFGCEDYFNMYDVDTSIWVKVVVMQFQVSSSAARWALSVDRQLKRVGWGEFGAMLIDRFGRDQQELLIRQLFHIRQTSSVAEYISRFNELVDQLIAYGHTTDPLYYSTRFVDGLRDDIRSVVLVQQPSTRNTACTLAMLQEEVVDSSRRRDYRRMDNYSSRPPPRNSLPLPAPPLIYKTSVSPATPVESPSPKDSLKFQGDKFASLRAYRRARGLCEKCAEKWHHGHKCSTTIQLNVV